VLLFLGHEWNFARFAVFAHIGFFALTTTLHYLLLFERVVFGVVITVQLLYLLGFVAQIRQVFLTLTLETLNKVLMLNGVGLRVVQIDEDHNILVVGDKSKVLTDVELYVDNDTNYVSVHFIQPSLAEEDLKETKKMRKSALNRFYDDETALGRIHPADNLFDVDEISSFKRVIETVEKGWVIDTPVTYDIKKIRAVNRYD